MSTSPRPRHLLAAFLAVAATLLAEGLEAQPRYPDKPLRLVVGFAPGGAADTVARALADQLGKQLNQTVIVENRTGASGNIATQAVLAAPADGYTLMFAGLQLVTNPAMIKTGYSAESDVQMVTQFNSLPVVLLVRADSPWKTIGDVTAAMKSSAGGGGLAFGSGGIGTSSHLAAEQLSRVTGSPYTHVPFRGGALATQALLAGDVQLMFDLMSSSLKGMIDARKVRPIAVAARNAPGGPTCRSNCRGTGHRHVHIGALDVSNVIGIPAAYSDPRMRTVSEKSARVQVACQGDGAWVARVATASCSDT